MIDALIGQTPGSPSCGTASAAAAVYGGPRRCRHRERRHKWPWQVGGVGAEQAVTGVEGAHLIEQP